MGILWRFPENRPSKLLDFTFSIWWDEPGEFMHRARPRDIDVPIGGLEAHPVLEALSIDLGILIQSFAEDAPDQLLALPSSSSIPLDLRHLALLNVSPGFLEQIAQDFAATQRRDVFAQLMTALSNCDSFAIETYMEPSEETIEWFEYIEAGLTVMGVDFSVWWMKLVTRMTVNALSYRNGDGPRE